MIRDTYKKKGLKLPTCYQTILQFGTIYGDYYFAYKRQLLVSLVTVPFTHILHQRKGAVLYKANVKCMSLENVDLHM